MSNKRVFIIRQCSKLFIPSQWKVTLLKYWITLLNYINCLNVWMRCVAFIYCYWARRSYRNFSIADINLCTKKKRVVVSSKGRQNQEIIDVHVGLDWNPRGSKFLKKKKNNFFIVESQKFQSINQSFILKNKIITKNSNITKEL